MTYALSELLRGQLELTENFLNSQKKLYTGFVNSLNTAALQQQQQELIQRQQQRQVQEQQQQQQQQQQLANKKEKELQKPKATKKDSRSRKSDQVSFQ